MAPSPVVRGSCRLHGAFCRRRGGFVARRPRAPGTEGAGSTTHRQSLDYGARDSGKKSAAP